VKAVITGGGFIGSKLAKALLARGTLAGAGIDAVIRDYVSDENIRTA
jgi:nucleoside-diphosphate-sugar epimerase